MYFFIFIILFFILIPNSIEEKYPIIIYFKIFISSIIYFSLLNVENTLLTLLLTVLAFIIIMLLIYRLLKNKMEEKEEDNNLFNLAHEVKNPLAVCKGYLDMIDGNNQEHITKYLPIIKSEMNRALVIMDDFLNLKRIKLDKDLMDFSLLIEDTNATINLLFKDKNLNLTIPSIEEELIIDGDYDKLKQVLINLIKNSYEASAKNVNITYKVRNNYLVVKIIDDGKGISKEDLKRIGEAFYTTKALGTGLGVNFSKEIIELHNGTLSYESIIDKGTTATIVLPIKYIY